MFEKLQVNWRLCWQVWGAHLGGGCWLVSGSDETWLAVRLRCCLPESTYLPIACRGPGTKLGPCLYSKISFFLVNLGKTYCTLTGKQVSLVTHRSQITCCHFSPSSHTLLAWPRQGTAATFIHLHVMYTYVCKVSCYVCPTMGPLAPVHPYTCLHMHAHPHIW